MKSKALIGVLCAVGGGVCWGFSGACGQYLFEYYDMDAYWLTAVRMFGAGVILWLCSLIGGKWRLPGFWRQKLNPVQLLLFAWLGLMFCQFTYLMAIGHSNAGTATVLQYLGPVLVMVYVCLRGRQLPTLRELSAIIFALAGTFILATHGQPGNLALSPAALFWGLTSALAMAVYTIIPGSLIKRFGNLPVLAYAMLIGGLTLGFCCRIWLIPVVIEPQSVLAISAMVVLGTALPFPLYLYGVEGIGAVKASMLASAEPVVAVLLSALWLHTKFAAPDILGIFCILLTVFLLAKDRSRTLAQAEVESLPLSGNLSK